MNELEEFKQYLTITDDFILNEKRMTFKNNDKEIGLYLEDGSYRLYSYTGPFRKDTYHQCSIDFVVEYMRKFLKKPRARRFI